MGKIAKGVIKINFTMLYGNYCYIFIENFPQEFFPSRENLLLNFEFRFIICYILVQIHNLNSIIRFTFQTTTKITMLAKYKLAHRYKNQNFKDLSSNIFQV